MLDPVKIVYLLGRGRSGATFIEHLIAERSGIVQLGEVQNWPKTYTSDHLCSCGKVKIECEFWTPVIEGLEHPDKAKRAFQRTAKRSYLTSLLLPGLLKKLLFRGVSAQLLAFYAQIRTAHGRDVMLDCSKNPAFGASLSQTPGLNVVFIHVVRHPLGVVYSWKKQRNVENGAKPERPRKPLFLAALEWSMSNLMCEIAKLRNPLPSIYVRYENLGDASLQDMISHQMELVKGGEDHPTLSHVMSGTPGAAWDEFIFEVEEDDWKTGLTMFEKILYGAITYPLFAFYMRRD